MSAATGPRAPRGVRAALFAGVARVGRADPPPHPVHADDPRLADVRRDVAARLRAVCADLSERQFEELVAKVAAFHLRWHAPRRASVGAAPGRLAVCAASRLDGP